MIRACFELGTRDLCFAPESMLQSTDITCLFLERTNLEYLAIYMPMSFLQ